MRSPVALFAIVALGAGCTFLIEFEEVAPIEDAGSSAVDANDVTKPADDTGVAFPPPCDPTFPLDDVKCNPDFPRPNCAKNEAIFASYPAGRPRESDLVTCNGGTKPTCVQHCPFGCATMPMGYPDACDDCDGRPNGTYCVKDLRGPDGRNLDLAVDCVDGKTVTAHVCGKGRCASTCPRATPKPACCI